MKPYLLEMKCEFLSLLRTPRYSLSTILFPSMFYIFFGILMKQDDGSGHTAAYIMTAMCTMGAMMAAIWGPGAGIAMERAQGWLQVKRASPMPPLSYFLAKIAASLTFCTITVAVVFLLGGLFGNVHLQPRQWALLGVGLVLGSIPFSAIGFWIGYIATPNSAPAMINLIVLPMSFLSGLWIPIQFLPKGLRDLAEILPGYHLDQIANIMAGVPSRENLGTHVEALVAALCVFGGMAWAAWRRDDRKVFG